MKIKAFTLIEQLLVMTILGIMVITAFSVMKPANLKQDALKKAGKSIFITVEFSTKNLLAKYTNNYTLTRMKDSTGEFSIEKAESLNRMIELYKKALVGKRTASLEASYTTKVLTDGTRTLTGLTVASYSGFTIKNGAYFGVKLNGNCTTTIDYIYDPSTPEKHNREKTCGTIFFDVNGKEEPNTLGLDQYIIALGKRGIK